MRTGELSDGVGEVGLADAGGADEDAVCLLVDEFEGGGAHDDLAVDGLGVVEVEGVEAGKGEPPRVLRSLG
jgi:hypothetical protein